MPGSKNSSSELPTGLIVAVLGLTLGVMALGAAVLVIQLRPDPVPETKAARDIAIWEQRIDDNPNVAEAYTGLGVAYEAAAQSGNARTVFEHALTLNPNEWVALLRLGVMNMEEDPAAADRYLVRSADAAPRNSKAGSFIALGDLRLAQGDAAGAKQAYEAAVADAPFLYTAHFGLARALELLGDIDGAIEQYRRAADFYPSSPEVEEALLRLDALEETP